VVGGGVVVVGCVGGGGCWESKMMSVRVRVCLLACACM